MNFQDQLNSKLKAAKDADQMMLQLQEVGAKAHRQERSLDSSSLESGEYQQDSFAIPDLIEDTKLVGY